jgi:hypothetical protein
MVGIPDAMKPKDLAAEAVKLIMQHAATHCGALLNEFAVTQHVQSAIEKAQIHRCPDCGSWITRPRAAHATEPPTETPESKATTEAYPKPAHESEPTITKADIQTTGEKIPYFGHMRKKR